MGNHTEPPQRRITRRTSILTTPLVLALIGVVVIVAGGIIWAVFAQAPESVEGRGIITPRGRPTFVPAPATGVVTDVTGTVNTAVNAHQTIAVIERPDGSVAKVPVRAAATLVEFRVIPGTHVQAGDPIAIITTDNTPHRATAFVPAAPGESIAPGMRALVSPGNLPQAQYGAIEGVVTTVAPLPVSGGRLNALFLANDSLVRYFTEQGPALEVTVRLVTDAGNPSGFAWSVGHGPDEQVSSGTLATVSVITGSASIAANLVR